jgi:hypothetical protein
MPNSPYELLSKGLPKNQGGDWAVKKDERAMNFVVD